MLQPLPGPGPQPSQEPFESRLLLEVPLDADGNLSPGALISPGRKVLPSERASPNPFTMSAFVKSIRKTDSSISTSSRPAYERPSSQFAQSIRSSARADARTSPPVHKIATQALALPLRGGEKPIFHTRASLARAELTR